jgi:hypothetical protein
MSLKGYYITTMLWVLCSLLFFSFYLNLFNLFYPFTNFIFPGIFVFAAVWGGHGLKRWRASRQIPFFLATVVIVLGGIFLWQSGWELGHQIYFRIQKPRFERLVRKWEHKIDAETITTPVYSGDLLVQVNPVLRIAFVQGDSLEKHGAVIYDPSDELAALAGTDRTIVEAAEMNWKILQLSKIFWGDVTSCQRLQRNWYYCTFG